MKVVISDYVWPNIDIEKNFFDSKNIELVVSKNKSDLKKQIVDADGLLFCFESIDEDILRSSKNLKVAQRYGIGVDNINIEVATELGIVVSNIPDYCIDEVSDHAMSMILSLNRLLARDSDLVKKGLWNEIKKDKRVYRLSEATLGLLGFGRIGRRISKKAKNFGLKVIAYDPYLNEKEIDDVEIHSLNKVLKDSNIISLHLPLTEQTNHIIDTEQFDLMNKDTILINVSRGGLINEEALIENLNNGKIRGAGLDVIESSTDKTNGLFSFDNVIITPHTAFFSQESSEELQLRSSMQLYDVLTGSKPKFLINPDVLNHPSVELK
ncbi:MAG: C-terminal binding protein [Chloroflexota bacterium]|jgi:D-3-phosphoglycerate dehydrogenase|nr:hydroxyacid dehydrogenase [Chloroflexota bacterium]MEC7156839.1 C-terminal binding protein [Chloroflexota bacterium]MEC7271117.1 C-terminal binding protein [Chloroflexota bacterium]MEC8750274.1 C-terminal binding protein [Chloroflexota bacterium]|tara:strand:+ start:245 stop:1216 length:972 start_codon:yes stop_codon:yes gene_type:complete